MKFFSSLFVLLLVIALSSAKYSPTHRDKDEFVPVSEQVSLTNAILHAWSENSLNYFQYEVTIHNSSPFNLLTVHVDFKNSNQLILKDGLSSVYNAEYVIAYPYNQFVTLPGQTVHSNGIYRFSFTVQGDAVPDLAIGSIRY